MNQSIKLNKKLIIEKIVARNFVKCFLRTTKEKMDESRGDSPTLAALQQQQLQQQQQDQLNLPPPPPQGPLATNVATTGATPLSSSLDYESDAELISLSQQNNNLNAKQQRQQKRRRERAQRLQAERDSHARTANNSNSNGITTDSNSIGEDSNNSSTGTGTSNCTTASQLLNGVIGGGGVTSSSTPGATDCIASLLLNPPNSPDSGLHPPHVAMAQTDSEDESVDEDLLSTSSSSTLLLPSKDTRLQMHRDRINAANASTPLRRKVAKSPVLEEEIIDGFSILAFTSYEDLEVSFFFSKLLIRFLFSNFFIRFKSVLL